MKYFIFLCLVVSFAALAGAQSGELIKKPVYDMKKVDELFEKFIEDYSKTYKDEKDKQEHFERFKMRLADINKMNEKFKDSNLVFYIYEDMDLNEKEFNEKYKEELS
ncbi:hypothetical protein O0L34_g1867 [Tuta absoluta]|nr:hypothetical protein O0L34_g1867 [Tuta absoluta]